MQVVPVIDFQAGRVVRAIGGRRAEYRPLASRLTNATDPLGVARAIRDRYGWSEIYVADLDAIAGAEPAWDVFGSLRSTGLRIWVDAGVRTTQDAIRIADQVDAIVLGLETLGGSQVLEEMAHVFLPASPNCEPDAQARKKDLACASGSLVRGRGEQNNRLIFSLDLRDGRSLGNTATWGTADPLAIAQRAIAARITRMIVLDLARVGGTNGPGTESLCAELAKRVQVFVGGGVRGRDDLRRLEALGVTGALVASALHEGIDFD